MINFDITTHSLDCLISIASFLNSCWFAITLWWQHNFGVGMCSPSHLETCRRTSDKTYGLDDVFRRSGLGPVLQARFILMYTVYPKKYAHDFCFAVLCCGYTLTDFPISIKLTSLALWQSNDCPSASKVTLMNMDKYFMWIHYERLHNHNKAKHNKTVCIFLRIYCISYYGCILRHCNGSEELGLYFCRDALHTYPSL